MFTADQLVAHAVGDYVLQSDWMVREKTRRSLAALVHCLFYVLPFLFITQNPWTLAVIAGSHFVLDRWHVARYVAWLKNPPWMAGWLLIIIDNILHILINGLAIHYIG